MYTHEQSGRKISGREETSQKVVAMMSNTFEEITAFRRLDEWHARL